MSSGVARIVATALGRPLCNSGIIAARRPLAVQSRTAQITLMRVRPIHTSSFLLEPQVVKVPSMGDSITEGTIVDWEKKVGDAVTEGEVVALIETDKVTIDIKAEMDGVITALYGGVDDNVEVGAKLYQIDADATASEKPAAAAEPEKESTEKESAPEVAAAAVSTPAPSSSSTPSTQHHRESSIHFLGKSGWAARKSGEAGHGHDADAEEEQFAVIEALAPEDPAWDPMYGRPPITEEEMDALMLGGAAGEGVPQLIQPSRGAVFA